MDHYSKKSKWIWTGEHYDEKNPIIVYFRKELMLNDEVDFAALRISADSRYRLYVNGVSIAQGPCKGDNQVWYYDEVESKEVLHKGMNILTAIVLRYPTNHERGNHSVWRTNTPGFYFL